MRDGNLDKEQWFTELGAANYLGFVNPRTLRSYEIKRYDMRPSGAKQARFRYKKSDLDSFLESRAGIPDLKAV